MNHESGGAGAVARSRWECVFAAALMIGALAVFLSCALATLRFGDHADESRTTDAVLRALQSGLLLPGWYNYPSLMFLLSMVAAAFHVLLTMGHEEMSALLRALAIVGADGVNEAQERLKGLIGSDEFRWRLRAVFAVVTSLAGTAVALAARAAGVRWLPAALVGALTLSSFQVFYHSRWVAADGLALLATALALGASLKAMNEKGAFWLTLAAIAAGFATAAKYPVGCMLLLPIVAATRTPGVGLRLARVIVVFVGTFLLLTPGAYVDPVRFFRHVLFEVVHYAKLGHGPHTMDPGTAFLAAIGDFVAFRLFSPSPWVSALAAGAAVAGGFFALRANSRMAALLVGVPVVYVAYFSTNRVLFVRNLLVLAPFIAVLAGLAIDSLIGRVRESRSRWVEPITYLVLAFGVAGNFHHAVEARRSYTETGESSWVEPIRRYVAAHPDLRFAVSPRVARNVDQWTEGPEARPVFHSLESSDVYLFVLREHNDRYLGERLRAITNKRGTYEVVAGPKDVDLDYYPTWDGLERVIAMQGEPARLLLRGE